MAAAALSLHSKQPKRIMISCEKAYIEIMEYPRGQAAVITDGKTGEKRVIREGRTEDALKYECLDMERAILEGRASAMEMWKNIFLMQTAECMKIREPTTSPRDMTAESAGSRAHNCSAPSFYLSSGYTSPHWLRISVMISITARV